MAAKSRDCVPLSSLLYALIVRNGGKVVFGLVGFVFVKYGHHYAFGR